MNKSEERKDHLRNMCQGLLLPTGSEEREVLGLRGIPVAILPSCQGMKIIAL